jgi:hypothetical protein
MRRSSARWIASGETAALASRPADLFDTAFCGKLIDLGRQDVAAERERIARFFAA